MMTLMLISHIEKERPCSTDTKQNNKVTKKNKKKEQKTKREKMEVADIAIAPLKEFMKDSVRLVKKCTKPDRREFTLIASKTAFGAFYFILFSLLKQRSLPPPGDS